MRFEKFVIVRSMLESQKTIYKAFTIWFCRKATTKKKIFESLFWQYYTFANLLTTFIKTTLKSK